MKTVTTGNVPDRLPTTARLGLLRGGLEVRVFFRQRTAVVFVFALPAVLLALLSSILNGGEAVRVTEAQVLTGGLVAAGLVSTSFLSMGTGIVQDQDDRSLKRLHGTPVPAAAYFLGKLVLVAVTSVAETVLLLGVAVLFFHVPLPHGTGRWTTFAWVFVLGGASCTLLGIAASGLARNARSAPATLNLVFLVLEFMSGVFVLPITTLPRWMVALASLFPLKWVAQGMRSVFLPDGMMAMEEAGTWEHLRTALALGIWCLAGLALCLATFRWNRRDER